MNITVNGKRHDIPRAPVSYAAIASLAGYPDSNELYVKWSDDSGKTGTLSPDQQIDHPSDSLAFRASHTGGA